MSVLDLLSLEPHLMRYAWGSRTALPRLLGRPDAEEPWAELWYGAHPRGSAKVDGRPLIDVVAESPLELLGARVVERFGPAMPFLVKLLAAAEPLSLQVHPPEALARQRFEAERAANVPVPSMADANAKPELLVALEPFELIAGLRDMADARELLGRVGFSVRGATSGRDVLSELLLDPAAEARAALRRADEWPTDPAFEWARRLAKLYPADPAALAPLVLEYAKLEPKESIALQPGTPHAYLCGAGLEVMASSDNVIRGGLTSKAVDVAAFLEATAEGGASRARPELVEGRRRYPSPSERFLVEEVSSSGAGLMRTNRHSLEILVGLEGQSELRSGGSRALVSPGAGVLVPSTVVDLFASGHATYFRVFVPVRD